MTKALKYIVVLIIGLYLTNTGTARSINNYENPRYDELRSYYINGLNNLQLNLDSAKYFRDLLYKSMDETNDSMCLYFAYQVDANINYFNGDLVEAIGIQKKMLNLCEIYGDTVSVAIARSGLGTFYSEIGMVEEQIDISYKTILMLEEFAHSLEQHNNDKELKRTLKVLYAVKTNLAISYLSLENFNSAEKYMVDALDFAKLNNYDNPLKNAEINLNLIRVYAGLDNEKEALIAYKEAILDFSRKERWEMIARCHKNIGQMYFKQGNFKLAEKYLIMADSTFTKNPIVVKGYYLDNLVSLANLNLDRKQPNKAAFWLKKGAKLLPQVTIRDKSNWLKLNWLAHKNLGNFNQALIFHEQYMEAMDSLQSEDQRTKVIASELNFQMTQQKQLDHLKMLEVQADLKNQALEASQAKSKLMYLGIIGGLFILFAIGFTLFALNRNRIIAHQKELLNKEYDNLKEFTENATHEMQTPMAVIHATLNNLLNSTNLSPGEVMEIDVVSEAAEQLSKLNRSLLLITKIENNQFPINEEVNFSDQVHDTLNNLKELFKLKGLDLELDIAPEIVSKGNSILIRMLINNLMSNALKYSTIPGNVKVKLDQNSFEVTNTGKSLDIDPSKLFERFVRNDKDQKGSGIGLSIVKKVCEAHNWLITYQHKDILHTLTVQF